MMSNKTQFLAYYLPQYHPIPENDEWWGKGFTEWTNVAKAQPLFKGHYQPVLPGELGFYDLRVPEVQRAQAALAKEYGIDGFIYYQYWFGDGKMLLEKPAEAMLKDPSITAPFCFCWANETWRGIWHGLDNPKILVEQRYNGEQGFVDYFNYLLPFFKDDRYIKVDNKPMFHVYRLDTIPDLDLFLKVFNSLAVEAGFDGVYLIVTGNVHSELVLNTPEISGVVGLDVFNDMRYNKTTFFSKDSFLGKVERKIKYLSGYTDVVGKRTKPLIADYLVGATKMLIDFPHKKYISCVFPNWDNSARSGKKSLIFINSNPDAWKLYLQRTIAEVKRNPDNPPFIIIKSWNEWAEGNYLEPDMKYGRAWLEKVLEVKNEL